MSVAPAAEAAKEIPSPWTWNDYAPTLLDVSCSSPGTCVAVGQRGTVLRSVGDGRQLAWSAKRVGALESPDQLTGVTCTQAFCLAVSNSFLNDDSFHSKVYRSTDHGATWSGGVGLQQASAIKPTQSALAVACDPAADACYAVGPDGGVWRSEDKGVKWEALTDLPPGSYRRVACPEKRACVAIGGEGGAERSAVIENAKVTSVNPPAGSAGGMQALACDAPTRCVATDGMSHFMTMDLSKSPKAWEPAQDFMDVEPDLSVSAMACPRKDVCVGLGGGVDASPHAVRTTSLSADPVPWQQSPLGTNKLKAISCAGATCVAVGKTAAWFTNLGTIDVGDDFSRVNEVGDFNTIQCSAVFSPTCVAGGTSDIGVSRSRGRRWSLPVTGPTLNIGATGCTGPSACLFVGQMQALYSSALTRNSFTSVNPATGAVAGAAPQACITGDLCVALGDHVVYTTRDAAMTPWTQSFGFPLGAMPKLACIPGRTDPPTCVAFGEIGTPPAAYIEVGTMSQSGTWAWHTARTRPIKGVTAVGCSPGGECTAVSSMGEIQRSEPGHNLTEWTKPGNLVLPGTPAPNLTGVACPGNGHCLAGGLSGEKAIIASTTDNWSQFSMNEIPLFEGPKPAITGFGCETTSRCVAVGKGATPGTGAVLVGLRKIG